MNTVSVRGLQEVSLVGEGLEEVGKVDAGGATARSTATAGGEAAPSVLIHVRDSTEDRVKSIGEQLEERLSVLRQARDREAAKKGAFRARGGWSVQQRRIFQRSKSLLLYWEGANYDVLWVVLTTARGGNNKLLAYHHKKLRNRIERELGYRGVEFLHVQTAEGKGVLHVLWAWKRPPGKNRGVFYIDQAWLSQQWLDIHGASYVFIKRYGGGQVSSKRVSRYLVSQYVSNQDALVRVSWSRLRSLGFPLARTWQQFRSIWKKQHSHKVPYKAFIAAWESLIDVRSCWLGDQHYVISDNELREL